MCVCVTQTVVILLLGLCGYRIKFWARQYLIYLVKMFVLALWRSVLETGSRVRALDQEPKFWGSNPSSNTCNETECSQAKFPGTHFSHSCCVVSFTMAGSREVMCRPFLLDTALLSWSQTETFYFHLDRNIKCPNPSFHSKQLNLNPSWISLSGQTAAPWTDPVSTESSQWATITIGYCNCAKNAQVKTLIEVWQRRRWWVPVSY